MPFTELSWMYSLLVLGGVIWLIGRWIDHDLDSWDN
jgi:hypothetical protein